MSNVVVETKTLEDGRVNHRIENYTQFWKKDLKQEAESDTENRLDGYLDVVNGALDRS
jgi:sterol 24-C-methyltransferase